MSAQNHNSEPCGPGIGPGEGATPDELALTLVRALARHAARELRAEQQGRPACRTQSGRSFREKGGA